MGVSPAGLLAGLWAKALDSAASRNVAASDRFIFVSEFSL
jgi:hypothetical protein